MIDLAFNTSEPRIIHIDLNSCFTTIEQQANRLLRGKPIGVAAYDTPRGFIIAASYPAKALGIKLGVNVGQAKQMCPGFAVMTPDPAKYREAHKRFKKIMYEFSSIVNPKSIDEFEIDMSNTPHIRAGFSMNQIGEAIKQRIYEEIGEAVTVNVGMATNRFLAKYAAGFDKPNGMTIITHNDIESRFTDMNLTDLPGINVRYQARLHSAGIMTPLDFLRADERTLKKVVFKSVVGSYWYKRLRGWEVDDRVFERKSIGHQYALKDKTSDMDKLAVILMKLCEKIGRRLRKNDYYAEGIHLALNFEQLKDGIPKHLIYGNRVAGGFETMPYFKSWHKGRKLDCRLYSSKDIFLAAKGLLMEAEIPGNVKVMSVSVYSIKPWDPEQGNLFEDDKTLSVNKNLSDAVDIINNRYGEFVVTPATMSDMQGTVLDRIAFGGVKDFE